MHNPSEYLQQAAECRALASNAQSADEREMLIRMALVWESLVYDRDPLPLPQHQGRMAE